MTTHKMLLISTGGTIAGEIAKTKLHKDFEVANAEAFSEVTMDTVSHLRQKLQTDIRITPEELKDNAGKPVRVDSSDIKPEHWMGLVNMVKENFDNYDSFVITHGTNTLGYTCAALSFAIANSGKPIVLTGSQVPIGFPGSDAKTNLDNAIRLATWRSAISGLSMAGVICVFGSHIITGTRVKKDTEFDYDAFRSYGAAAIGRIGRIIDIDEKNLEKHRGYLKKETYQIATTKARLLVDNRFEKNIVSLTEFPGMDYGILRDLQERRDVKGFIIRAFGAGDMSTASQPVLRYLKQVEVPVVVTSQAPNGNANMQVNEPGQKLREEKIAIPTFNMNIESQTAKLMWLLAQKERGEIRYAQLCEMMRTDMRGEINVIWEEEVSQQQP